MPGHKTPDEEEAKVLQIENSVTTSLVGDYRTGEVAFLSEDFIA